MSRLWHWVLAITLSFSWWLGEYMEFDTIDWHFYAGYLMLGLVGFRLLWGFLGPSPVRFKTLLMSPADIFSYLKIMNRREPSGTPGHNPVGSISVLLMIVFISAQAVTGLFIESDDFYESAPLASYVSDETIGWLTWWHHLNAKIILVLVALHVGAVLFYLIWKKENLIKPMFTGWKWVKVKKNDA